MDTTSNLALRRAQDLTDRLAQTLRTAGPDAADLGGYSVARALQYAASRRNNAATPRTARFEMFIDDEISKTRERRGQHSVWIPAAAIAKHLQTRATYSTYAAGTGGNLVETSTRIDDFIDALRPRSVALQLGATPILDLVGNVTLPRADTTSEAYWIATAASSGAVTESEQTFDATPLTVTPSLVGVLGTASRLFHQQVPLADSIISNDVAKSIGTAIDVAALQGSGSGGQPTGITNLSGVNAVSGATFAWSTAVSAVGAIAAANAIRNRRSLAWVAAPATAELLAERQLVSGYPKYIWKGNPDTGSIGGLRALGTANMPASTAIVGDFSQILILAWGDLSAIEIEANPFQNFASGDIAFRVLLPIGIAVRHPASFTVVSSIT